MKKNTAERIPNRTQLTALVLTAAVLLNPLTVHAEQPAPVQAQTPLQPEKSASVPCLTAEEEPLSDEYLYQELAAILEDTVSDALASQRRQFAAELRRRTEQLQTSRSFWRRAALAEGAVIAAAVCTGLLLYNR